MPIDENILQRLRANDTGLTSLNLDNSSLVDTDIQTLVNDLKNNTNLKTLYLKKNKIGDEGAKALAEKVNLNGLSLSYNKIGNEGAKALAQSTTLKWLYLSNNKIGYEGAEALAKSTTLTTLRLKKNKVTKNKMMGDKEANALAKNTTLRSLRLNSNEITNEGAEALAKNTTLTTLTLKNNKIKDEGAKALAKNANLRVLSLRGNNIGITGAQAFIQDNNLIWLSLSDNKMGDEGAKILAQNTTLKTLHLWHNKISDEGAKDLAQNTTLETLYLWGNEIGDKGAQKLAQNTTLKTLSLCENSIGLVGTQAFIQNNSLTWLSLSDNEISDNGAQALAQNTTLKTLHLWGSKIGDKGAKALAQNKTLAELYLRHNQITDEGAQALARNTTLKILYLLKNQITNKGAKALAKNATLNELSLSNNEISDEGAKALAENKTLTELYLRHNQITDEGAQALAKSISLICLGLGNNSLGKAAKEAVNEMLDRNKKARSILLESICVGDFQQVQERVYNQGQSIHTMNDKNQTLLHLAAQQGHVKLVSWLCEQGARTDLNDNNGSMPIELAKQGKHHEVVCYLMDKELALEKQQKAEKERELEVKSSELEQEKAEKERALEAKNSELVQERQEKAEKEKALEAKDSELVQERQKKAEKERELEAKDSELLQERQQREESIRELEATKLKLEEAISALLPVIPGDKIHKKDEIGKGGCGIVYQGRWLGAKIALKVLIGGQFSRKAIAELEEEAHKMARLRSPYVVTIYGITLNAQGQPKGIVMEYMPQGSLYRVLHDKAIKLTWLVRRKMVLAVARGLSFLHQQNIIHNDLKSQNVLVHHYGDEWTLKLTDFGLSRIKKETAKFTNDAPGTAAWMAPELFKESVYSKASDIYAYGIVLWEMVSRETPFKKKTTYEIMQSVCNEKGRPPISPEAPSSLTTLMQLCWKQNKVERLPTEDIITKLKALPLKQELREFDDRDNAGGELQNQRVDRSTSSQWSMG